MTILRYYRGIFVIIGKAENLFCPMGVIDIKDYTTTEKYISVEFTAKRSRFIGHIAPVTTDDEATKFISAIRSKHPDATHNVYAYALKDGYRRYSDDGEPGGTAGIPTLDVIIKEDICDIVIVTTRYFGGTLLGGGGLVRAYSKSATDAISASTLKHMVWCDMLSVTVEYPLYGKINNMLANYKHILCDTIYSDNVCVLLYIPADTTDKLEREIIDITSGAAVISRENCLYQSF